MNVTRRHILIVAGVALAYRPRRKPKRVTHPDVYADRYSQR